MKLRRLLLYFVIIFLLPCGCKQDTNQVDNSMLNDPEVEEARNTDQDNLNMPIKDVDEVSERTQDVDDDIYSKSVRFDADKIEVGDKVAEMELIEKELNSAWRLRFSGSVQLTGEFKISENDVYWGRDIIFFEVDEADENNMLPRVKGDDRRLWFVIKNYEEAYNMLIPYGISGKATIIIDEYLIDLLQSDIVNEARITEVIDNGVTINSHNIIFQPSHSLSAAHTPSALAVRWRSHA